MLNRGKYMNIKVIFTTVLAVAFVSAIGATSAHAAEPKPAATPAPIIVTVQEGDNLSMIADAHSTTYPRIFDANVEIADPDVINPGQKLRIPTADEQLPARIAAAAPVAVSAPAAAPAPRGSAKAIAAPATPVDGNVWDRLAQCESGGNWHINTGNGYYGGLQFSPRTWTGNGGGIYAPTANLATREQQIEIAEHIRAGRGFSPWPACAAKLGLK